MACGFAVQFLEHPYPGAGMSAGFIVLEALFVATSRDNLRKYYDRSVRLLGSSSRAERSDAMSNGSHPPKTPPPTKPSSEEEKKKPVATGK